MENISISQNLKQKFIRRDNVLAGPFKINKSKPNTYFDITNHELYNDNGTLYGKNATDLPEELISKANINFSDSVRLFLFNGEPIENINFSEIDEKDLCSCPDCTWSRNLLTENIKSDLIISIEKTWEIISKSYDNNIPLLPNMYYISVAAQKEILQYFIQYVIKRGGIEILFDSGIIDRNTYQDEKNQSKNKKPKSKNIDSKKAILADILGLQTEMLDEKNILLDISIKKLSKLSIKKLNSLFNLIEDMYQNSEKFEKIQKVKLINVGKKLSQNVVVENSIISKKLIGYSDISILNPKYIYSYQIIDGIITEIIPVSKINKK